MDDDQQFCLRWNNHQSTLVSVFDTLLENGTLVDCTLAAEGKYLKAHKVVLSACSPYFESLLTQQYDKHPIFILKDVKFQELKAMMDYMYRGEVNISQDQLAALLKAAESLQIKGLSDSRSKNESEPRKTAPPPPPAKTPPPAPTIPRVQGLTIEQRKAPKLSSVDLIEDSRSREGSTSPLPRKRKKPRRRTSQEGVMDNHDASNSSESHSNHPPTQNIPASISATPLASTSKLTDVPEPVELKSDVISRTKQSLPSSDSDVPQVPMKEKIETHSELMLEPKAEYIDDDMNEDSVEDLTLDDEDVNNMDQDLDHSRPGPSHGSGDGSSQGFSAWHMSGQNQDEVFLAAQEAVGAHRDSQGKMPAVKRVQVLTIENKKTQKILGDLKKELSVHLSFDKADAVKQINKKIVDKELTFNKIKCDDKDKPRIIVQQDTIVKKGQGETEYYAKQSIASCRMERFMKMTAADLPPRAAKQLACLSSELKIPKDTLRCINCKELFEPSKAQEHKKSCKTIRSKQLLYGCVQCSFKSDNRDTVVQHAKDYHK